MFFFDLSVENANEGRALHGEQAEEHRAQGVERRQIGKLGKVSSRHELLIQDAYFHFELLFFFDKFLQHLGDASRILSADNDRGLTG